MTELVLAISRNALKKAGILPEGLNGFTFDMVDPQAYAWLPRSIADKKDTPDALEESLTLGKLFPQILGYFQITDEDGRILTYQRKGKEKGLVGKWSIGVGGHVSQEDYLEVVEHTGEDYPSLLELVYAGSLRELQEELGFDLRWIEQFGSIDDFEEATSRILHTWEDATSTMHVGIPMQLKLSQHIIEALTLEPAEFLNVTWMTPEELKASNFEFETWSELLIDNM